MLAKSWRRRRGDDAEARVQAHLEQHGFRLLHRNWQCRLGELDLVMQQGDTLAIVEVRQRADTRYGGAAASVTATKQRKLVQATRALLAKQPQLANCNIRFDVAAIEGETINWIQHAFDAA